MANLKLRPYQVEALKRIETEMAKEEKQSAILQLATGLGKTIIFSQIPKIIPENKRLLIIAHRDDLIQQAAAQLRKWNPDIDLGIDGGGERAGDARVVIASVQTLGRHGSKVITTYDPSEFCATVVDESHHAVSVQYRRILKHFNQSHTFGFTATVNRHDGKGLIKIFNKILYEYSLLDGIQDRWLVPIRALRVKTTTNLDTVAVKGSDFDASSLGEVLNNKERNDIIIKAWNQRNPGNTLVFAANVEHSKSLVGAFKKENIKAEHVDGYMPLTERRAKIKAYKEGKITVLSNAAIALEGFDAPNTKAIIMARRTLSTPLYQQMLGRLTRTYDGQQFPKTIPAEYPKPYGLLLDVVDNSSVNTAVTVNDLFGLPNKYSPKDSDLDKKSNKKNKELPGEDVHEFISRIEDSIQIEAVTANLTQQIDVDTVIVDIFKKLPASVARDAKIQWYPDTQDGFYTTVMQNNKAALVGLRPNILGQWVLTWNGKPAKKNGPWDKLKDAMGATRKILNDQFNDSKNLWSKGAVEYGWGNKPASENQKYYLYGLKKKGLLPISVRVENLTRGEAAHLITVAKFREGKHGFK